MHYQESLISTLFMDLRFKELLANLHLAVQVSESECSNKVSKYQNIQENNKWDIMTFTNGLTFELLLQGHKIFKDYYKNDKARILEEDMSEQNQGCFNSIRKMKKLSKEEIKPLLIDLQMMLESIVRMVLLLL
jgi:bifunctional ADP-heptose synthase (sugar kinase/adenylyltransferase)